MNTTTRLQKTIKNKDFNDMVSWINYGEVVHPDGRELFDAIAMDRFDMFEALMDAGARVSNFGYQLFLLAAERPKPDFLKCLVMHQDFFSAMNNDPGRWEALLNHPHLLQLDLKAVLRRMAIYERFDLVMRFSDAGIDLKPVSDSLFVCSARINNTDRMTQFINAGADLHLCANEALNIAARGGHVAALQLVARHCPQVLYPVRGTLTSTAAEFALTLAVDNGHPCVVLALLESGVDINAHSGAALRHAVDSRDLSMVKLLIAGGADVNTNGGYPLDRANNFGMTEISKELRQAGAKTGVELRIEHAIQLEDCKSEMGR
jgi:hypothetical protein